MVVAETAASADGMLPVVDLGEQTLLTLVATTARQVHPLCDAYRHSEAGAAMAAALRLCAKTKTPGARGLRSSLHQAAVAFVVGARM